jgi:hypothetical protein
MGPLNAYSISRLNELEIKMTTSLELKDEKVAALINNYLEELPRHLDQVNFKEKLDFICKVIKNQPAGEIQIGQINTCTKLLQIWNRNFNQVATRNIFAPPMDPQVVRLIAHYLEIPARNNLYKATLAATCALRQTNAEFVIPSMWQELDPQKYKAELTVIRALTVHEQIKSPLLTREQKEIILKQEIYKILKDAWQADVQLRDNPHLALLMVSQAPQELQRVSPNIQNYRQIALIASTTDWQAMQHASDALKNDDKFVEAAITKDGRALKYASVRLKDDHKAVLMAVSNNGWAVAHASDRLKDDDAIALAAVTNRGRAVTLITDRLKGEHAIALAAVTNDGWAHKHISAELKNDKEIALMAISKAGPHPSGESEAMFAKTLFSTLSRTLRNDEDVAMAAIRKNGWDWDRASPRLQAKAHLFSASLKEDRKSGFFRWTLTMQYYSIKIARLFAKS